MFVPVNVDASFCKHEEPEVHVPGQAVEGSNSVVHQHAAVGQPQDGKYGNHYNQHFHNLGNRLIKCSPFKLLVFNWSKTKQIIQHLSFERYIGLNKYKDVFIYERNTRY